MLFKISFQKLNAVFGRGQQVSRRWISAGALALVVIIGIVFWFNRDAAFIQKNETLQRLATISVSETQTQARGYVWPMAIEGWKDRPILGWGQENFNYVFNARYNPQMWKHEQWFDRAHNVYLDWLVAGGALGLAAYIALYVLLFIAIRRSGLTIAEKSVLAGLVAGYAVHNVFVFDNLASYVMFFALLGFVGSLRPIRPASLFGDQPASQDVVAYVVAPIAIVLLVAGVYFLNIRPLQANTLIMDALRSCANQEADLRIFDAALAVDVTIANQEIREQLLQCSYGVIAGQYPNPTKQAFFERTVSEIQQQTSEAPGDARMYVLGGSFLVQTSRFEESLPLLEKARTLSPGKQGITMQLASAYLNLGRTDDALTLLKASYESDPSYGEAKTAYAIGLISAGR